MSAIEATLDRITVAQEQNQIQLNTLTHRLNGLTQRFDSFIYESQRGEKNIEKRANRNEVAVKMLHSTTGNLMRSVSGLRDSVSTLQSEARADRAEFSSFIERTDSIISRLDALVHYLMRNN
jgi:hypothetical protein